MRRRYAIPALQVRLDAAKLRYAARLSRQASPELRALVQGPGGLAWRQELAAGILVMQRVLAPKLDSLPDPRTAGGLAAWEALWVAQPGAWPTYVRQLLRAAVEAPARVAAADGAIRHSEPGGTDAEPDEWICMPCARFFGSQAAVNMHMTRVHGKRCALRAFVPTPECPVCHTYYHTRLRAIYHVKHTAACREHIESGALPELSEEALAALDVADLAHRRECRRLGIHARGGPPCKRAAAPAAPAVPVGHAMPPAPLGQAALVAPAPPAPHPGPGASRPSRRRSAPASQLGAPAAVTAGADSHCALADGGPSQPPPTGAPPSSSSVADAGPSKLTPGDSSAPSLSQVADTGPSQLTPGGSTAARAVRADMGPSKLTPVVGRACAHNGRAVEAHPERRQLHRLWLGG